MARKHPTSHPRLDPGQIKDITLDSETLASIGRIILICAELDSLITESILKTTALHHVPGLIILGRSEISSKLEKLQKILEINSPDDFMDIFKRMRENIGGICGIRNVLAHGTFLGELNGDLLFAATAKIEPGITSVAEIKNYCYPKTLLISLANEKGPQILDQVQKFLKLPTPRSIYISRTLRPGTHPPTPKTNNQSTTPPPPSESSQK
jgi:hypothetical protein